MNICETIDNFDINQIFYLDPIKNTVIDNSNFIRILYSTELLTLNGLYLLLNFQSINIINNNNRIKYCIDVNKNSEIINFIKILEKNILDNSIIKDKNQSNKLSDLLGNGYIKNINLPFYDTKFNSSNNKFILKISGIWESEIEYGLTYKILDVSN